jgi:hypothetical protein
MQDEWRSVSDVVPAHKIQVLLGHFGKDGVNVYAIGYLGAGHNSPSIAREKGSGSYEAVTATHWQHLRPSRVEER